MATIAQKFKNKISKKTFACPSCSKQLRVPIRPGKTLMVNCPRCHGQVQLSFKSPITELFKWEKGRALSHNMRMFSWRLKGLPMQFKIGLALQLVFIFWLAQLTFNWTTATSPSIPPSNSDTSEIVRKI